MDEYDLSVARDVGEMKADIRTIKHDLVGLQQSNVLISDKLNSITNQQSKGLGFFAGAAFIVTTFGGVLLAAAKLIFASGKVHP